MTDRPNLAGIITLQQHIIEEQSKHSMATGEFSWLLSAITLAGKIIASNVRQAGLLDVLGTAGQSPTTHHHPRP